MFKALMLRKTDEGKTLASIEELTQQDFPDEAIEIEVAYSTLNYKDGLAITGRGPVVRQWPMVPGIDLAGTITQSRDANFQVGDEVMVNGHGMGELHWGGLAQLARVPAKWLTKKPQSLSLKDTAGIGTAGYTAALSVLALQQHGVRPEHGPILVTGANGGVGSFAITLLANQGYTVHASTGRMEEAARLTALGATEIIERAVLSEKGKPLQKEQWAGAIDCVGSHTLANVCAQTQYGGVVTSCGLAQGMDFPATVAPFILRGITLAGIDSVYAPQTRRQQAWDLLAQATTPDTISDIAQTISLEDSINHAAALLRGEIAGRVVVDLKR